MMFSTWNRPLQWSVIVCVLATCSSIITGCGGGSSGPQASATATPTTAPVATQRIAWMSNRDGNFHIYVMNGDGTGQVRLTQNDGLERSPAWSQDGTRLVFSYSPTGSLAGAEIYSVRSDGSGLTRLTNNGLEDDSPALSSDGQFLIWSQSAGNATSSVFIAKSDGSGARQLSANGEFARTPKFDPQGRILYAAKNVAVDGINARYQIVRINGDGSGHVQLSSTTSNLYFPSVSPDGNTLLYADDAKGDFQIYSSPIASFAPKKLSFTGVGSSDPSWTPDGRILFFSLRDDNLEIYVANRDGSSLRRLTSNPAIDRLPVAIGSTR